MKERRFVFAPLLTVMLFGSTAFPQKTSSLRPEGTEAKVASPQWSQASEQQLLTKARGGDARSQMWLACGYEQGWFGPIDFEKALTWFKRAAAQGMLTRKTNWGECTRTVKV
jgi:TPR repeat protein